MKIEGSCSVDEKKKRVMKRNGGIVVRKKEFDRRTRRRVVAESAAIQRLFLVSNKVFKGPGTVPPPYDVDLLRFFLEKMKPEDFGLSSDLEFFNATTIAVKGSPPITYSTIYNCNNFSMCMFFLPRDAVIPLHNHPGMTVFSKLLLGSMHIKSYDWADLPTNEQEHSSNFRLARMVVDSDFTAPCNTCILYPAAGGNIHTFRAITSCVVLDVLGPPYSKEEDRDCTYYRDHPYFPAPDGVAPRAGVHDDRLGWLEAIGIPKDLKMVGVEYLGPQIINGLQ